MAPIELFHIGPQKSATTWLYRCCEQHPGMHTPGTDALHYFDLHSHRPVDWLERQFPAEGDGVRIDFTPSYIRDPLALERIHTYNPDARVVLHVRDPIDRFVSHYWHERKKRRFNYRMSEALANYDLYASWVLPGLYGAAVARCHQLFGPERTHVIFYEDIAAHPEHVLASFFGFAGVATDFEPTITRVRVNQAQGFWRYHAKRWVRAGVGLADRAAGGLATDWTQRAYDRLRARRANKSGSQGATTAPKGPGASLEDAELHAALVARFLPDMVQLDRLVGRVPAGWRPELVHTG